MTFTAFTEERLETLLAAHPVTPMGRSYIEEALKAPHDNVQGSTRNVVTDMACPKMKINIQSQLKTVHAPLIRTYVFSPSILGYLTSLAPIELIYKNAKDKTVRTRRRMDCLVFDHRTGVRLETWSHGQAADQEEPEDSPDASLKAIAEAAQRYGFGYQHVASDKVSSVADLNRKYLWTYLYPQAHARYAPALEALMKSFGQDNVLTFDKLESAAVDLDTLHWALAAGHLFMDFDAAELGARPERILVFKEAAALQAWQATHESVDKRPVPVEIVQVNELQPGEVLLLDGKPLTVNMSGCSAVHVTDANGAYTELSFALLISTMRSGKLVLPARLHELRRPQPLLRASPRKMHEALGALEALRKLDRGETPTPEEAHSPSTYRRWRKVIREGVALGLTAIEALVQVADRRGFHGPHIDLQLSEDINRLIREAQRDPKKPTALTAFDNIENTIEKSGRHMIARSTFYVRWQQCKDLKSVAIQEGHKAAYQLSPTYWVLHKETPVHARRAMELVHLDSTLLDIVLISSLSGEILGRPWLTLAMCAATRRALGLHLSFRPPSHISSMAVLADIVRRFGRFPDAVIHDWGSEFKSRDFQYLLTALQILRHVRPKAAARFGSCLERLFGVTLQELISNGPGNTKVTKRVRAMTPQVDPSTHAGLTLLNVYECLENFLFGTYDTRKHPTTLFQPRIGFEASLVSDGLRPHRMARFQDIQVLFCPIARQKAATVDATRGVFANHQYFGHPLFTQPAACKDVLLKLSLDDPGSLYAFVQGEWRICRSALHTDMQQLPVTARRCIFEELWLEHTLVTASHADARKQVRGLLESMNEQALHNREYFRDRELQKLLQLADVHAPAPDTPAAARAASLHDRASQAAADILENFDYGDLVGEAA